MPTSAPACWLACPRCHDERREERGRGNRERPGHQFHDDRQFVCRHPGRDSRDTSRMRETVSRLGMEAWRSIIF